MNRLILAGVETDTSVAVWILRESSKTGVSGKMHYLKIPLLLVHLPNISTLGERKELNNSMWQRKARTGESYFSTVITG